MRSSYLVFVGLSLIGAVFGTSAGNDDPVETAFEDLKEQLYGYKGSIIAGYNKRTYYKENESFLKDVSSCYEFGDGQILTNTDNSNQVFIALRSTAQPYTCADYQYVADDKFTSKKFLVFQSDSYLDPLMIYRENLLLSSSVPRNELNLCHFESSFINNHQRRLGWSIEQIN